MMSLYFEDVHIRIVVLASVGDDHNKDQGIYFGQDEEIGQSSLPGGSDSINISIKRSSLCLLISIEIFKSFSALGSNIYNAPHGQTSRMQSFQMFC